MDNQPISIIHWPQAILHLDGDSFFASVEKALNPLLKDKPVVTGQERGIASSMSYEAKKLGITRGMPIAKIKREYPECIIVAGNYEAYTMFATKIFSIMRRYTPAVEEYSIDEAFADITGLRKMHNCSYKEIAIKMQKDILEELNISVSVGVSLTKTLAKLCSNFRKPMGITCVDGTNIHILLQKTPIQKVWGIGKNTAAFLQKYDCNTAYDFIKKDYLFVNRYLDKKEREIYNELKGEYLYKIKTEKKSTYQSISKAKTFTPTKDKEAILSQLYKNIEDACAKSRKYNLAANKIIIVTKTQQFFTNGQKITLSRPSASANEIYKLIGSMIPSLIIPGTIYRQTACVLSDLTIDNSAQLSLFEDNIKISKIEKLNKTIDNLNKKFGYSTIHFAKSLKARSLYAKAIAIPKLNITV
jgi:DNA polymerase-4/DNA polymerase V